MKNSVLFLSVGFVILLCLNTHGQNSPLNVNSTNGQSLISLTSSVGWGGLLKFEKYNNPANFYALETGAGSIDDLRLHVNGNWSTPIMSFKSDGSVGIGTSTPQQKFHVEGNFYVNSGSFLINQTASTNAKFYFSKLGTYTWDLGTETSDPNNNFILFNRTNSTYPLSFNTANMPTFKTDRIRLEGMSTGGGNIWDFKIRDIVDNDFGIYSVSQSAYRLYINGSGNVGIGTTDPKGYKLAVAGKIISEEVVVKLQANWPDYVFEKDYKLPSLQELQLFIAEHKHLPGVPSAKEVEEKGLPIGEMNAVVLKKVEELTLYIIDIKKEMDKVKDENQKLKNRIIELEKN